MRIGKERWPRSREEFGTPCRRSPSHHALMPLVCAVLFACCMLGRCPAQSITMWHPWARAERTVSNLAAEYTRQTGVRVTVRAFSPVGYSPWTGGSRPDIIGLSNPSRASVRSNAMLGRAYNVQPAITQGWYTDLWNGPLETFILRGSDAPNRRTGTYGVPLTVYVQAFIYNRNLFRRAGVAPPRTWSEFLTIAPRLRQLGVVPMAGGLAGTYPSFPVIYEWSYLGSHYLLETYFGRYPYTGQRWQNQFRVYDEMRRYRLTTYDAAQMSRTSAERFFLSGGAAVILDGPWFETMRRATNPRFTNWGVFGPPEDRRAPFLPRLPGGVAEGAIVNNRSINRNASVRFLRWLTEPAQQVKLANAMDSIPVSMTASRSTSLQGPLRAFVPYVNSSAVDLRSEESPAVLSTLYSGARSVVRGTTTPARALSAAQSAAR